MEEAITCARCERILIGNGGLRYGGGSLCPVCLIDSFTTSSGIFAPESTNEEARRLSPNVRVDHGRFRLVRKLGEGGMGVVWLAEDTALDRNLVALKFVSPGLRQNTIFIQALREELILARRLSHRCVVKVHDWHAPDEEPPFLSMEFVDGSTLAHVLAEKPRGVQYSRFHPIFVDVCEALEHAHHWNVLHRDIKPGNILLTPDRAALRDNAEHPALLPKSKLPLRTEWAKLSDFGIGKSLDHQQATGRGRGTVPYMSPAQAQSQPASAADDIFALGATMYQALTGMLPYGEEGCLVAQLVPLGEALENTDRATEIPLPVRVMVMASLHPNALFRPNKVSDMLDVLRRHPPRPSLTLPPIGGDESTNWVRYASLVLATLAFLSVALYFLISWTSHPSQNSMTSPLPVILGDVRVDYTPATLAPEVTLVRGDHRITGTGSNGLLSLSGIRTGTYDLSVKQSGYRLESDTKVDVEAGPSNAVRLVLKPELGGLRISVPFAESRERNPSFELRHLPGDQPVSRGAFRSETVHARDLPPGLYEIAVHWPNESTVRRQVAVEAGPSAVVDISFDVVNRSFKVLDKATGLAIPAIMTWEVPGRFLQTNTPVELSIREGSRMIFVKAEGYHQTNIALHLSSDRLSPKEILVSLERSLYPLSNEPFTNRLGMAFVPLVRLQSDSSAIWISQTEVTVGEFKSFASNKLAAFMGMNCLTPTGSVYLPARSFMDPGYPSSDQHPVTGVSWRDAVAFCEWLTDGERGRGALTLRQKYLLQTAEEWQEAGIRRGAQRGRNFAGAEQLNNPLWPNPWRFLVRTNSSDGHVWPVPVRESDTGRPEFDVRNLADNAQEWCRNPYTPEINPAPVRTAYESTLAVFRYTPEMPWRVVCGGSWYDHDPLMFETTTRHCALETERNDYRSFRIVIEDAGSDSSHP